MNEQEAFQANLLNMQANIDLVSPVSIAEEIDEENELAEIEAKEAKILSDMAQCGSYFFQPDPRNGRNLVPYQVSCGYWRRGCERCLDKRAGEFQARFHRCVKDTDGGKWLGIAQLSKEQAKSIVKKMKRVGTGYWRIPLVSGGVFLIFDSLHFPDLDNPELHEPLDWTTLCQTPKKSRYSGNLGRHQKEEKTGLVVKIPRFKVEMDDREINRSWSLALRNTDDLNPSYDVEEIEDALQVRMDAWEEAIISMGGEIVEKYRVMGRVQEASFGWKEVPSTLETIDPDPPPGFVQEEKFDPLWARKQAEKAVEELFDR